MANVYLGAELLNGGGSSPSTQPGAVAVSQLAIWSGTYQEYEAIATPDVYTIYFVKGNPTAIVAQAFSITQTNSTTLLIGNDVTFTVATITGDPDAQPGNDTYQFKWWLTNTSGSISASSFTTPSGGTGIGTSQANATLIEDQFITANSPTTGGMTVNVAVFDSGVQVGAAQAFTPMSFVQLVTLSISSSYGGASFFWQCGGPSVSASVTAGSGSIRVGGEVDPDQGVSQSASITSGDATYVSEVCYGWGDGFGFRMYAQTSNSTMSCSFSASERSLKKDIKLIGISKSGLNIYSFKYINKKFGKGTFQGVMADEMTSDVVAVHPNGYRMVNYSAIDVDFKQIKK